MPRTADGSCPTEDIVTTTPTKAGIHLDVPEPTIHSPNGTVIVERYCLHGSGQYPLVAYFDDSDLAAAVERWAAEGLENCSLWAEGVYSFDPDSSVTCAFLRGAGKWSQWE
jgi:hypothetical protein